MLFNSSYTGMIFCIFLMILDKFRISKLLFLLETTGLIPDLVTISTKYLLKIFANLISEVTTFSFSI